MGGEETFVESLFDLHLSGRLAPDLFLIHSVRVDMS